MTKPVLHSDADALADAIIARTGKKIVLALPLGLGKACHIANALVKRAIADSSIDLRIFTALTLEKPATKNDLERRFLDPASDRLFGRYPNLDYATLLHKNALPANIQVNEFFLLAGRWLDNGRMQRNYIPANYTHALSYILDRGVNVVGQLVSTRAGAYSLGGNTDITVDLLKARAEGKTNFIFAAQANSELPFMSGDALLPENEIDFMLSGPGTDFELFSAPREPVSLAEQAIGLYATRLVHDGGTLQIGIGAIGDAVAHALILRHMQNDTFRRLTQKLSPIPGNEAPFETGVYGVSEMFVDGFLHLAAHGILKREVDGAILHAGFFLDTRDFYKTLRDMPEEKRARFHMKPVSFTNQLYGDEELKRKSRIKASFINTAMMVTLRGAIVSDALEDGRVVSGVGGQYDFAAQSFALGDARFIVTLNATRQTQGKTVSNIVWSYGHETISWHLRDIVITEYGIADLRGRTEEEAVQALLCIADSRFQPSLLAQAKTAKLITRDYTIPEKSRDNTPDKIKKILQPARADGSLPPFPFGTDFTPVEQRLLPALDILKQAAHSKLALIALFLKGFVLRAGDDEALARMGLKDTKTVKDFFYRKLLQAALEVTRSGG